MKKTVQMLKLVLISTMFSATSISFAGLPEEEDSILDFIPGILSAIPQTCNLNLLSSCDNQRVCTNSGGYWYSEACNVEEIGLARLKMLIGTWDFEYTSTTTRKRTYIFNGSNIRPIASLPGNYAFSGIDTYDRVVTATYNVSADIYYISVESGTTQIGPTSNPLTLFLTEEAWAMAYASKDTLVGLHKNTHSFFVDYTDPAIARKN